MRNNTPLILSQYHILQQKTLYYVCFAKLLAATNNLSEHSLVAPYKLIGLAALSVESAITFFTLFFIAASIIFSAP